jgi:hypothetical protein
MSLDSDLTDVFYAAGSLFVTPAAYTHVGSAAVTIQVIFDRPSRPVAPQGIEVEEYYPQARVRAADINASCINDSLVIAGETYYIRHPPELTEDGLEAVLNLSKV